MRHSLFIYLLVLTSVSCKKDKTEDPKIDCGCKSKTERLIEDAPASLNEMGGLIIFEKYDSTITSVMAAEVCNLDTSLAHSPDMQIPNYLVSGNLKTKCVSSGIWTGPESFEITRIQKIK